jgi:DNA helicase-2/ATP-dependent DNA helicase PcrA
LRDLARLVVAEPNHVGAGKVLNRLAELRTTDPDFRSIELDCVREFYEGVRLGSFDTPQNGFAEITHRRSYSRPAPPAKAISTIHKAKGLECADVIIMPCDSRSFPDNQLSRCLLYVAMSRATNRLMFVIPRGTPSPLLII